MEAARFGEVFNFGALHMEWPTALFVFVVFMITVFALNQLLYKPLIATLEARGEASDGAEGRLEAVKKELVALEEHYKQKLNEAHQKNEAAHTQAVREAQVQAQAFLDTAHAKANAALEAAALEVEKELATETARAKELASGLALLIQNKVLAN